jgi:hypothetical protein
MAHECCSPKYRSIDNEAFSKKRSRIDAQGVGCCRKSPSNREQIQINMMRLTRAVSHIGRRIAAGLSNGFADTPESGITTHSMRSMRMRFPPPSQDAGSWSANNLEISRIPLWHLASTHTSACAVVECSGQQEECQAVTWPKRGAPIATVWMKSVQIPRFSAQLRLVGSQPASQ